MFSETILRFKQFRRDYQAPRLSISIVIWILSSDTICQLNQFHTNGEAAVLSNQARKNCRLKNTKRKI